MSTRPETPRIPPLSPDQQDDQARELLAGAAAPGVPASHIFSTLVRHPGLFRKWMPFGGKLLAGKLPARERELLILRTGWRCQSVYEWGQHVLIARAFPRRTHVSFDAKGRLVRVAFPEDWDIDGIPVKAGATPLAFHDNGRPRELILARSHAVSGRRYDSGTLLRFDRDGRLIYVQP